ncbi:hypothetical protein CBR_g31988 [Chara braunii]|uniref:Uncharacterized protein n=1 Tax=Chara braunii TaxID=69332 RepID=A0A388LGG3_CHABU|nr:hypothetical protein CBR_g31988 [Chara braunii]|eukprot:GBG81313.1 hypothetical protein CBR_g31988 [Chara braunii]
MPARPYGHAQQQQQGNALQCFGPAYVDLDCCISHVSEVHCRDEQQQQQQIETSSCQLLRLADGGDAGSHVLGRGLGTRS